jgi:hypothetical protein
MREASELPQPSIVDIDPEDPSQLLDDVGGFSIEEFDVEAQPSAEAHADVDFAVYVAESGEGLEADSGEGDEVEENQLEENALEVDTPAMTTADAYADAVGDRDSGDLYGVYTPKAEDRDIEMTPDKEVFVDTEQGEHWLETLGKTSTEYGPEVEHVVDVVDDSDEHIEHRGHHGTESGDPPVADKGSGGISGL